MIAEEHQPQLRIRGQNAKQRLKIRNNSRTIADLEFNTKIKASNTSKQNKQVHDIDRNDV